ncbi:MAG: peptidoglycan-binding protein [Spirochaetaceae bacterium]|jgi:hypothetical protein|nr:peptidoglycan-binding protein [Spirochaetaceae bacterium]
MNCKTVLENLYNDDKSFLLKLKIKIHKALCLDCADKERKLRMAKRIMLNDFMPPPPDITDRIMAIIGEEKDFKIDTAAFSFRSWIFTGIFILLSLTSVYLGRDFHTIVINNGLHFILPLGITIGIIITAYCAVFIGTHLNELCEKFGLHTEVDFRDSLD